SSICRRLFGTPVVPPVSKVKSGLPSNPFGIQRRTGPPRNHSSWKGGNFLRSSKELISRLGSQPSLAAKFSQKGHPVSELKCHFTISRTWASSRALASCVPGNKSVAVALMRFSLFVAFHTRVSRSQSLWRVPPANDQVRRRGVYSRPIYRDN